MDHSIQQQISEPIESLISFRGGGTRASQRKRDRPGGRNVGNTLEQRQFVAWDGEGVNLRGEGKPQSYVLFGSSEGHISSESGLSTWDCLEHIIETGRQTPRAIHVGFAFTYDTNMIIKSLSPVTLARLHSNGWVRLKRPDGTAWVLTFAQGKYFRVTRQSSNYDRKKNPHAKVTVQIYDIFSFFAKSFIRAYEEYIGPIPDIIRSGKANRKSFTIAEFETILSYWSVEIQLLKELANELRRRVYNAGLRISQWHGPGALASYAMAAHSIRRHMGIAPEEVRMAARYAYAGGRFELFKLGRIRGPIYGVDINSAYPYAISQLPSLAEGEWQYIGRVDSGHKLKRFAVYHLLLEQGGGFRRQPGPLFHRDMDHNISFPWYTEGWYWSPEAFLATQQCGATILEGWEFVGSHERPFAWIADMYAQRQDWKSRGISAQLALKLCMNSMYGKLAQRVGWDETRRRIPPWHQLEWAGWVTSYTRARLYNILGRIPFQHLVAVETDGIYTTMAPDRLGINASTDLGGWEVSEYDDMYYVQSGLAWLHGAKGWEDKRRGLDPETFSLQACREYLSTLHPKPSGEIPWQPFIGETTRFLGLGQALASSIPTEARHCVWETQKREINAGQDGKRVHVHSLCEACKLGLAADEMAHDLCIRSLSMLGRMSVPHSIPWEPEVGHARWRDYDEEMAV